MAWSWSHTADAYVYAESRLRKKSQKHMAEIWAEWKTWTRAQEEKLEEAREEARENDWVEPDQVSESGAFDQNYYRTQLKEAWAIIKRVGKDTLADDVWTLASEYATCTNGGHEAYMCPYGCGCHMVPFGEPTKER